jgi:hypothetical protein
MTNEKCEMENGKSFLLILLYEEVGLLLSGGLLANFV